MGLCKCKTKTDQYCFEHKKHVCEECLVSDAEHKLCHVATYQKWLACADYSAPVCAICRSKDLSSTPVLRLTCLGASPRLPRERQEGKALLDLVLTTHLSYPRPSLGHHCRSRAHRMPHQAR